MNEITGQEKDLDIFYVVSKVDPEERLCSDDEDSDASGEEERVQDSKKRRVLEKLIKNGYLPAEGNKERFHALSAWKINKWNQQKKKNPRWNDPEYDEYIEGFERFKRCLQTFCEVRLLRIIERVSSVLIGVLSRCLDFFIKKANVLHKDNEAIRVMLQTAQEEEQTVNASILHDLENRQRDIAEVIENTIHETKGEILKEAVAFEYDLTKVTDLTSDGHVSSQAAATECRSQIRSMVINKLQGRIKEKLLQMFSTRDQFVSELEQRILNLEKATSRDEESPSTAAHALAQSLVTCYDVQVKTNEATGGLPGFFTRFLKFLFSPKLVDKIKGKVPVGKAEWKKNVASKAMDGVNPHEVTENLIKTLKEHFVDCHNMFAAEIKKVETLFTLGETMKDEQRKKIQELAPEIAMLEMLTHSVLDRQKFGVPEKGELIGSGAQGNVYACKNIRSPAGKPCVVKVVPVSSDTLFKDLTLELHNTR